MTSINPDQNVSCESVPSFSTTEKKGAAVSFIYGSCTHRISHRSHSLSCIVGVRKPGFRTRYSLRRSCVASVTADHGSGFSIRRLECGSHAVALAVRTTQCLSPRSPCWSWGCCVLSHVVCQMRYLLKLDQREDRTLTQPFTTIEKCQLNHKRQLSNLSTRHFNQITGCGNRAAGC